MVEPQVQPLIGFPGSWTPGTKGAVTADVVRVQIDTDADFERYRGKLAGKIVLTQPARTVAILDGPVFLRMTEDAFREAAATPIPDARRGRTGRGRGGSGAALRSRIQQFFKQEGVVALFDRGSDAFMAAGGSELSWQTQRTDGGTVFPTGGGSRGAMPAPGFRA